LQALIALLLAILFAQAVPAHEITLERSRGPVFSAATVEVTLPPRKDDAGLDCLVAAPDPHEADFQQARFAPVLATGKSAKAKPKPFATRFTFMAAN